MLSLLKCKLVVVTSHKGFNCNDLRCRKIKQSKIKDLKVIGNTLLVHDYHGDKCL